MVQRLDIRERGHGGRRRGWGVREREQGRGRRDPDTSTTFLVVADGSTTTPTLQQTKISHHHL